MPRTLDFSKLSLQDALDLAIMVEEEAKERYTEFAEQIGVRYPGDAAHFFKFMSTNEDRHGKEIAARRKGLFGDAPVRVDKSLLWDVEAPTYDKPRLYMTPREAMEVALQSEIKAHEFFVEALKHIQDPDVRELFDDLCKDEEQHEAMVRKAIAKLPTTPDVDPDVIDEPSAQ